MNHDQQKGYDFAKGAFTYMGKIFIYIIILTLLFNLCRKTWGLGMDDSDTSKWERSGLRIHTDHKTGLQYLSDGNGGLILRGQQ